MEKKIKLFFPKIFLVLFFLFFVSGVVFSLIVKIEQKREERKKVEITTDNFEKIILQINTSEKLVEFLNNNFSFNPEKNNDFLTLEEFLIKKRGGEQEFARTAAYILYKKEFISFIFVYQYIDKSGRLNIGFVTSFRDTDLPKYIYFNEKGAHLVNHGQTFEELCQKEEERLNVTIIKYAVLPPLFEEFIPKEWAERAVNH